MKLLRIIAAVVSVIGVVGIFQAVTAQVKCNQWEIASKQLLETRFREMNKSLERRIGSLATEKGIAPLELKIIIQRGLRNSREIQTLFPDARRHPLASFVVVARVEYRQPVLWFTIPLSYTAFASYERSSMPGSPLY
ncbi:MAG: hypothetical protein JXQ27_04140 [Acidobacteria bacterium]|nr:hypothetical protein [Acidobacteriota bacterium]